MTCKCGTVMVLEQGRIEQEAGAYHVIGRPTPRVLDERIQPFFSCYHCGHCEVDERTTQLHMAALKRGIVLVGRKRPEAGDRLMYRVTGPKAIEETVWLAPGEMANHLGVKW